MENRKIWCECGAQNVATAFRCVRCRTIFDGRAGNTVPHSRALTEFAGRATENPERYSANAHSQPQRSRIDVPAGIHEFRHIDVAIVTFNSDATLRQKPTPPGQCAGFTLKPTGCTNELAGLQLAADVWRKHAKNARLNIIVFGDDRPNEGAGILGMRSAEAAVEEAQKLRQEGARIATIGFRRPTIDF